MYTTHIIIIIIIILFYYYYNIHTHIIQETRGWEPGLPTYGHGEIICFSVYCGDDFYYFYYY